MFRVSSCFLESTCGKEKRSFRAEGRQFGAEAPRHSLGSMGIDLQLQVR